MPKRITIMAYTINELKPEIKDKVIEKFSEINTSHDWYENSYEGWAEKLAEYGLEADNYTWDLYRNEFDFTNLRVIDAAVLLSKLELSKELIPFDITTKGNYDIQISFRDGLDVTVDSNNYDEDDFDEKLQEPTDDLECVIFDKVEDLVKHLKSEFFKQLKDDYEYLTSEEAIIDTLDANEHLFTKEGKAI
jgi:hypothetical protein